MDQNNYYPFMALLLWIRIIMIILYGITIMDCTSLYGIIVKASAFVALKSSPITNFDSDV